MDTMISLFEAAMRVGVSDKTLRRAIDQGKLVAHQRETGGKHNNQPILITEQDLEAYIAARQPVATAMQPTSQGDQDERITALEQRLAELAETLQNDHLLNGPDYLALGSADDAHYESRMDALEQRITELAELHRSTQEHLLREQQETRALRERVIELEKSLQDTQDLVVKQLNQPDVDQDEYEAFTRRIQPLVDRERARLEAKDATSGQSVQTQAKQAGESDGPSFMMADFARTWQSEYRCEAIHKDVKAIWILKPYLSGGPDEYVVKYCDWDKVKPKGRVKPEQRARGEALREGLRKRAIEEMFKSGWDVVEGDTQVIIYIKKDTV